MANVTFTDSGIKVKGEIDFKKTFLELVVVFSAKGDAGPSHDKKAPYYEKFITYFGQEAGKRMNKAVQDAHKQLSSKADAYDTTIEKAVVETKKKLLEQARSGDTESELGSYAQERLEQIQKDIQAKLEKEVRQIVDAELDGFIQESHEEAEKRIMKDGEKVKKSKAKTAIQVKNVTLALAGAGIAIAATVATVGAATPLLVAVAAWIAVASGTAGKLISAGKEIKSIRDDTKKLSSQMDKKLAELDKAFKEVVGFASKLLANADAVGMQAASLKQEIQDTTKLLEEGINPKGYFGKQASALKTKLAAYRSLLDTGLENRKYHKDLLDAYLQFQKVQQELDLKTGLETMGEYHGKLDEVATWFRTIVKEVEVATS